MKNVDLNLTVFSSNLNSLISIYNDSEQIRQKREEDLELRLKVKTWSKEEFEEYSHYKFHFDWLLIQSLFISGFSHFENYLRNVAEAIERNENVKIKIQDFQGNGQLDIYRKYIYLIGEIQSANSDRREWQTILEFKLIRNAITHKSGFITKKLNKINEHNLYYGFSEKLIRIKNIKFLEDFVNVSIDYMKSIADEFGNKYDS